MPERRRVDHENNSQGPWRQRVGREDRRRQCEANRGGDEPGQIGAKVSTCTTRLSAA